MKFLTHFLWSFLIYLSTSAIRAEVGFYGIQQEDGVHLQWHPRSWDRDQIGYSLKRREAVEGSSGGWISIGPAVLRPSVDYNRDYTKLGLSSAQSRKLKSEIKLKGLDKREDISESKMGELLAEAGGIQIGDMILLARDAAHSMACGLGYFDRTVRQDGVYEYGLFKVRKNNIPDAMPVATIKPLGMADRETWPAKPGLDFFVTLGGNLIGLDWKMPVTEAERLCIAYFKVEHKIDDEHTWLLINKEVPYGVLNKVDSRWSCQDRRVREKKATTVVYRLTPVDYFQKELKSYEFSPPLVEEPDDPEKFGPKITDAMVTDGKLKVSWEQPVTKWRYRNVAGFSLGTERRRSDVDIRPKVPGDRRELEIDLTELQVQDTYLLSALYESWDGYSLPVRAFKKIDLPALIKAEAERPKPAKE